MKPYLYLLIAILFTTYQADAQLTNGLIAHWPFSGNANDATSNGHNGTATNVTYTVGMAGTANTAAKFNGTNSFIHIPYQSDMNISNFSICALVKPQGYYSGLCQGNVLFARGSQYKPGFYMLIMFDNAYDNGDCYKMDTSKNVFAGAGGNLVSTSPNTDFRYTPTVVTQTWYCVITTYDGNAIKTYVNGALMSTAPIASGTMGTSTEGAAIGASRYGKYIQYPYWFNGIIDDMRLYNRALSANEVSQYCGLFNPPNIPDISITGPNIPTDYCAGDQFTLHYATTGAFNAGNTFTAELSNASGAFGAPTPIGSVNATGGGTIACTIPPGTPAGTGYRVRITSSNPSQVSPDNGFNLTIYAGPNITTSTNSPVCAGTDVTISAVVTPASSSVSWTGPNGFTDTTTSILLVNAQKQNSGKYIIIADNGGCSTRDTVEVIIDSLDIELGNDTFFCEGSSLLLSPMVSGTYLWHDGSTGNSYLADRPGLYYVTVTSGSCADTDSIVISTTSIDFTLPEDTVICPGEPFVLTVPDTFQSYLWNDGTTGKTLQVNIGGSYWVQIRDKKCSKSDSIIVKQLPGYIDLGGDTTICDEDELLLVIEREVWDYIDWSTGDTGPSIKIKEPGIYSINAGNKCGDFSDSLSLMTEDCQCKAIVPDAFTPNNDGLNDKITPIVLCNPQTYKFMIMHRRGQVVFESDTKGEGWDGYHNGKPAGVDTYFYLYQATDIKGRKYLQKGDIILIR